MFRVARSELRVALRLFEGVFSWVVIPMEDC